MPFFRKKPVLIEARQFSWPTSFSVLRQWVGPDLVIEPTSFAVHVHTLEGPMLVSPGDWIIRGVKGEFYPCKPDIFAATYEPAPLAAERTATPSCDDCGLTKVPFWFHEHTGRRTCLDCTKRSDAMTAPAPAQRDGGAGLRERVAAMTPEEKEAAGRRLSALMCEVEGRPPCDQCHTPSDRDADPASGIILCSLCAPSARESAPGKEADHE